MNILVTGARGFIGWNLVLALNSLGIRAIEFHTDSTRKDLTNALLDADAVVHLAGINRPADPTEFHVGNVGFTKELLDAISNLKPKLPVIFTSSIQAELDNEYGRSKYLAEQCISRHAESHQSTALIFRLPNVFGKWARPNYNSVVATFCHNLTHGLSLNVHDAARELNLVYVDDVVTAIQNALRNPIPGLNHGTVEPVYKVSIGALRDTLTEFWSRRSELTIGDVGSGLSRALYSTLLSYAPPESFTYPLNPHADDRGRFAEFLRSQSSGQVSFFTAKPGVTRGGHYHHTKLEKFLVVQGSALLRLKNVVTGEVVEINANADRPLVVEPPPGWAHDITNTGSNELVVLLWANEVFNPNAPDTYSFDLGAP
jgi:UDP-2-acetamido-2,6-beta-L-arabino-hexul-4-ose reductase